MQNRIVARLRPRYFRLLVAYSVDRQTSRNVFICELVQSFFDNMNSSKQQELLNLYESLTPEERNQFFKVKGKKWFL